MARRCFALQDRFVVCVGLPWIPTDEEWQQILDVTRSDSLRDRTMLALAYDGPLRREELCSVGVADLDFSRLK